MKVMNLQCPHCRRRLGFAWEKGHALKNGACPHCQGRAQIEINGRRALAALPVSIIAALMLASWVPATVAVVIATAAFLFGTMEVGPVKRK